MGEWSCEVVVLGSGVIGLTTAICLAEAGLRVLVRTEALPARTNSAAAGAMVGPLSFPPGHTAPDWERETLLEFMSLARLPDTGVRMARGLLAARPGSPTVSPDVDQAAGLEPVDPQELPPGFEYGFRVTLPLVDMPVYLAYLADRLANAGGRVDVAPARSLDEVAQQSPLMANCTGVGARELVPDPEVHPVRGQQVIVENPGLDTFFLEAPIGPAWAGYFPHGDHVVLGGTATPDDWNMAADPATAREIQNRCAEIEPRLRSARVIGHRVGLRPVRPTVRLEVEMIGPARCVHNYGHGGLGVSLSWGCAREAAALLVTGEAGGRTGPPVHPSPV
ncbi:FAD-dependent oxidoreductase [Planosporangium sp. 12N6]|uniref:FAD-dependent oxidoreductase n=1 Tax=Planosporangium spinosum TaxID=3402278 RepID=UPI003CEF4E4B